MRCDFANSQITNAKEQLASLPDCTAQRSVDGRTRATQRDPDVDGRPFDVGTPAFRALLSRQPRSRRVKNLEVNFLRDKPTSTYYMAE